MNNLKNTLFILILLPVLTCFSQNGKNALDKKAVKQRWDTLYVSENNDAFVIGDSITKQINYIAIKFEPDISFNDFPVDSIYRNRPATIDWSGNNDAKKFKTTITETYKKEGINFAGHYCFVFWGCGSPCQSSIIIDAITGKIYNGLNAALGYNFKIDSRMIIVNPTDSSGYYLDCPYCKPEIYIFDTIKNEFRIKK